MYQMIRLVLPILVIVLAILACGTPAPATSQPARTNTPGIPIAVTNTTFSISVEYAILGVADTYTAAGVKYAKLQDVFTIWGNIEPEPGRYESGPLDALVLEYQKAGFTGLQMDLSALSPWASSVQPSLWNQEVTISMSFESASALLTTTPTGIGQTRPEIKTLSKIGGKLTFDLEATPVFIQEVP